MKRIVILIAACMMLSSCGLLGLILSTPPGQSVHGAVAGLAGLAPNPRNLQATEDPGTGLCGYLNEMGVWALPPIYSYAGDFDTDLGLAVVTLQGGRCGAIDVFGNTVIEFNFYSTYDVRSAMSSIKKGRYTGIELWPIQDRATGLYGYLDHYGNWHIQPQYLYTTDFTNEGFAVVQFGEEKWGAIDRSNRVIIQPNFTSRYNAKNALDAFVRR